MDLSILIYFTGLVHWTVLSCLVRPWRPGIMEKDINTTDLFLGVVHHRIVRFYTTRVCQTSLGDALIR